MRRFVWLASWPKSGNTWVRLLLANLLSDSDDPVSLDELGARLPGAHSSSRRAFDEFTGVLSAHCTDAEAEAMRPGAYRYCAVAEAAEAGDGLPFSFRKVHDACHDTIAGEPLFPEAVTAGAVYVIRNPLDTAVSFAFHAGRGAREDMTKAVAALNDPTTVLHREPGRRQLRQRVGDWSSHVQSWTGAPFPLLVLRYEDLLADAGARLAEMAQFLGLDSASNESRIARAVEFSTFARLREAEDREGFKERHWASRRFFRSGRAGDWRRHLTADQAQAVLEAHGTVMSAWGYDSEALLGELRASAASTLGPAPLDGAC